MNELYEPVRAWAEYDEYRLFGDYCCGSWHVAVTPTGNGPLVSGGMHDTLSVSLLPEHFGPLRSLRVLLRSGHDFLLVHAWDGEGVEHWQLLTPTNGHDGWNTCVTNWKFVEGQDTEAVSRALAEAQRWLEENESALERAFSALGWDDPYIVPEDEGGGGCAVCGDWASAGTPTPDGYKWFCSTHCRNHNDGPGGGAG